MLFTRKSCIVQECIDLDQKVMLGTKNPWVYQRALLFTRQFVSVPDIPAKSVLYHAVLFSCFNPKNTILYREVLFLTINLFSLPDIPILYQKIYSVPESPVQPSSCRPSWLAIDLDFINNLWLPNVFIYDLKEFKVDLSSLKCLLY